MTEIVPNSRNPVFRKALCFLSSPGLWAIYDQGFVSLGNFLTNILLARALAPSDYGVFALLFGTMLLLNNAHASLVTYPLSVQEENDVSALATSCLLLTLLCASPSAIVLTAACWILHRPDLALPSVAALVCWQLQETMRRTLMVQLRYRDAIWGDAISYLGQASLVLLLIATRRISLLGAFAFIGVTSLLGMILQIVQIRVKGIRVQDLSGLASSFWRLGKLALLTNVGAVLIFQAFPWTLAFMHGASEAAAFAVVFNLVALTHPLLFSFNSLVIPLAARANRQGGLAAAKRVVVRQAKVFSIFLLPYCATLLLFPGRLLVTFYGAATSYSGLRIPLQFVAASYILFFGTQILWVLFNSIQQTGAALRVQIAGALSICLFLVPLIAWNGIVGASIGFFVLNVIRIASAYLLLMKMQKIVSSGDFNQTAIFRPSVGLKHQLLDVGQCAETPTHQSRSLKEA